MKIKTYVLLRATNGHSDSITAIIRRQPGVVMVDQVEGLADIIFTVQASSRKKLAELTVQAISKVEGITDDVQLLPMKE
jgi:hypothetical protein